MSVSQEIVLAAHSATQAQIKREAVPGSLSFSAAVFFAVALICGVATGIISVLGVIFIPIVLGSVSAVLCGVAIILFIAAAITQGCNNQQLKNSEKKLN